MSSLVPAVLAGAAVAAGSGLGRGADLRLLALRSASAEPARAAGRAGRAPLAGLVVVSASAGLVLLGPVAALLLAGAAAAAARLVRTQARASDQALERRHAVEACAALAAELRAGRPPAQALAVAAAVARGPSHAVLEAAAATARWGGDVPAALLSDVGADSAVPEVLRGLAACWRVCARAGSGLAAAVERLAEGLRSRQEQEHAVAAALAGPRASATLLAGLPLAGIALAAGLGAHPLHVLLHTPLGIGCLAGGIALDALGLWWTGRIVARAAT